MRRTRPGRPRPRRRTAAPASGPRKTAAQRANRSYVSHSQAGPKRRAGRGVVPPSPRTKQTPKSRPSPSRRRPRARRRAGGAARISGPYMGQKKTPAAAGSARNECREGWSMGAWRVWPRAHPQKGQLTSPIPAAVPKTQGSSRRAVFPVSARPRAVAAAPQGTRSKVPWWAAAPTTSQRPARTPSAGRPVRRKSARKARPGRAVARPKRVGSWPKVWAAIGTAGIKGVKRPAYQAAREPTNRRAKAITPKGRRTRVARSMAAQAASTPTPNDSRAMSW